MTLPERSEWTVTDEGIKTTIWVGALAARHACVEQSRYAAAKSFLIIISKTSIS
jgi:hypothetical protein